MPRLDEAEASLRDHLQEMLATGKFVSGPVTEPGGMITHFSVIVEYLDGDGVPATAMFSHPDDTMRDLIVHSYHFQEWARNGFADWLGDPADGDSR